MLRISKPTEYISIGKFGLLVLIVAIAMLLSSGCVTIPPQTAALSAEISSQIAAAKKNHNAILDEYEAQRQARIDDYMHFIFIPRLIARGMKKMDFQAKVCDLQGEMDRALVLQEIIEAINKQTVKERRRLERPLRKAMRTMRADTRDHYDRLEGMNRAVTSNLRSVIKDQELRNQVLKALKMPTDTITPIRQATDKLDGLFKGE